MSTYVICIILFQLLALAARCDVGELIAINTLTDDVLLEMFDFYVIEGSRLLGRQRIEGWQILVHVSQLEKRRFSVTTSPQSATPLNTTNTGEGHPRHLADLASHYSRPLWYSHGTVHQVWKISSLRSSSALNRRVCQIQLRHLARCSMFRIGICNGFSGNAQAFPGADRPPALQVCTCGVNTSRFVLGRIRAKSAIALLG